MKAVQNLTFLKPSLDSILGSGLCIEVSGSAERMPLVGIGLNISVATQKTPAEMRQTSEVFLPFFTCVFDRGAREYS